MKSDERCEIAGRSVTSTQTHLTRAAIPQRRSKAQVVARLLLHFRTSAYDVGHALVVAAASQPRAAASGTASRGRATAASSNRDLRQTSARRVAVVVRHAPSASFDSWRHG